MSGEFYEDDPIQQRSAMLEAIEGAINNEDYEFVTQIAGSQDIIKPFELVEYLDVKRRSIEDPVTGRRWEDALTTYLQSIKDQEFPVEEVESINSVIDRLKFDHATQNQATAEEPTVEPGYQYEETIEDPDWKNDKFSPAGLDKEEIVRLSNSPMGKAVVAKAKSAIVSGNPDRLAEAIKALNVSPIMKSGKLRSLLDVYIMKFAESKAKSAIVSGNPDRLAEAIKAITNYGSDDSAIVQMRRGFDKYVYDAAKSKVELAAVSGNNDHITVAIKIIEKSGSSERRIHAMLAELGLV